MFDQLRVRVLLSVQRALLGEISPDMRAISVHWSPTEICLRVYADRETTQETEEAFDAGAITQIIADFPYPDRGDPVVGFEFIRVDPASPIALQGQLVFARVGTRFQTV